MTTFLQLLGGAAGLALLYYGAEFLVKGGVAVALRLKISPLVIGLTLVAFATSAPELVVSVDAALRGAGDIAIGNVIGSNICNIALILGLAAVITPLAVNPKLFRVDVPVMIAATLVFAALCALNGGLGRIAGGLFFAGLLIYVVYTVAASRHEQKNAPVPDEVKQAKPLAPWVALMLIVAGLAALIGGAKLFVGAAVHIARLLDVSDAVIGLTVVAVGTSLPELATSVVAAIKGEKDIAVGNVVGSNIFNILAIMGIAPLLSPVASPGIAPVDLAVLAGSALVLAPVMRTGFVISRAEGALLLAGYCAYTAWLIAG